MEGGGSFQAEGTACAKALQWEGGWSPCDWGRVKVKSLSRVRLFATPWTVAHQAPLSMGFSRQEHWSGLPFLTLGESPQYRDQTCISFVSCIGRQILHRRATWEAH